MDTVTHALLGLAIGALRRPDGGPGTGRPLSHTDKAVLAAAVIGAELPDLDVVLMAGGPLNHIRYHRGFSHSLAASFVLAALTMLLVRRRWPRARPWPVYLFAWLGVVVGHLLADWVTSFGTRLLLPFSNARLALDWMAEYEPLFVLPFVAALALAWRWPRLWRRLAAGALALGLAFVGYRAWAHGRVVAAVRQAYRSVPVVAVTAHPVQWSLVGYEYVVEAPDAFYTGSVRLGGRPVEDAALPKVGPGQEGLLAAALRNPEVREIMAFARHPLVRARRDPGGYLLYISDLRGGFAFNFRVRLDPHLAVRRAERDYSQRYVTALGNAL